MKYSDVAGFCNFENIYKDIIENIQDNNHIVEVGTLWGRSAILMAELIKNSGINNNKNFKHLFACGHNRVFKKYE